MNNFADAVKTSKVDIVPKTVITSGSKDGESNIPNAFESLVMLLMSDKLALSYKEAELSPEAEAIKEEILKKINQKSIK